MFCFASLSGLVNCGLERGWLEQTNPCCHLKQNLPNTSHSIQEPILPPGAHICAQWNKKGPQPLCCLLPLGTPISGVQGEKIPGCSTALIPGMLSGISDCFLPFPGWDTGCSEGLGLSGAGGVTEEALPPLSSSIGALCF